MRMTQLAQPLSVLDAMTSPLSHALANVMKRAAVISMAFIYAQRPVTPLHLFGVALSVFGTLLYQQLDSCRPAPALLAWSPRETGAPAAGPPALDASRRCAAWCAGGSRP